MKKSAPSPSSRFHKDERGNVTILFAGSLLMLFGASALAVDTGSIYLAKRDLQGIADAAALAAARTDGDPRAAAEAAIAASNNANARLQTLTLGGYTRDTKVTASKRFTPSGTKGGAVQVTVQDTVPLFFARILTGSSSTQVVTKATAAKSDVVAFSIGSRLASVRGGLPNALLSALIGTNLSLSVADYDALVGADVDVLTFADALRTELHMQTATFGQTLNATATLPQLLKALANSIGDETAAAKLRSMSTMVAPTQIIMSQLIDLGPYAQSDVISEPSHVEIDAYSMFRTLLETANGHRQVMTDLSLGIPGVASSKAWLAIGERPANSPWLSITKDDGAIVRTAQARLYVENTLVGIPGIASVRLPLYVELAQAQAQLASVSCEDGARSATATVDVTPAIGQVSIADIDAAALDSFSMAQTPKPASLLRLPLVEVTGFSDAKLGGTSSQSLSFTLDDVQAKRVKSVSTGDIAQATLSSLAGRTSVQARIIGLPFDTSTITQPILSKLLAIAPPLDDALNEVMKLLGVRLGEADTRVSRIRCGTPMLVG